MTLVGLQLGPPGVYHAGVQRKPEFRAVRLDVAGFVGVAPRGPVDQPVVVESWSDYRWRFGGYEGPGLLPWAIRTFFAQGGRRAYVCRVSPLPRAPSAEALAARAAHKVTVGSPSGQPLDVELLAANEGAWGSLLQIRFQFTVGSRFQARSTPSGLVLPDGTSPAAYSLLRVRGPGLPAEGVFRWVEATTSSTDEGPMRVRLAIPSSPLPEGRFDVEVVTLRVEVRDPDPSMARTETLTDLGLRRGHPRFVGDVLGQMPAPRGDSLQDAHQPGQSESLLIHRGPNWPDRFLPADPLLPDAHSECVRQGSDRWNAIGRDSLFGDVDSSLLPVGGTEQDGPPVFGADLMSLVPEVALLAVPDLFWNYVEPEAEVEPDLPRRPAEFEPCVAPTAPAMYAVPSARAARLDGRYDLPEILARQTRLVALAERQRRFVALLDVPEHLSMPATKRWRSEFDSSYAAAYHPWLGVMGEDLAGQARAQQLVPPSAFAAGIIAERERRLGLPYGPANELAAEAVVAVPLTDAEHTALHEIDVDVFRAERDGFRLTSAHTLARDRNYRQLSVRRLMTMLRLVLDQQSQWLVFEPHTPLLRRQLRDAIVALLRDLYRAGAFIGDSEEQAFFVRCDESVNPEWSTNLGRLVAEVGVAPSQPLEYLVLQISQDTDGAVRVEG
jgi:uncharacterized protein